MNNVSLRKPALTLAIAAASASCVPTSDVQDIVYNQKQTAAHEYSIEKERGDQLTRENRSLRAKLSSLERTRGAAIASGTPVSSPSIRKMDREIEDLRKRLASL